jgi:hypothetical protein
MTGLKASKSQQIQVKLAKSELLVKTIPTRMPKDRLSTSMISLFSTSVATVMEMRM